CALSFGAMHGQPVWIAYAVLLGLMLCLVRDACGSLWGPICFHISFNMVGSFLLPQWRMQGMQAFGVLSLSLAACFFLSGSLGLGGERKAP
ncbi:MAG: CPBP family intramembrane metalloprotease, partial [Clostridia bacterium]|nr:CPBP family intramembrane metalloprotease [Clostridia bacterium]